MLRGYCQSIVRLLFLQRVGQLSHTIEGSQSYRAPLTTSMSDELISYITFMSQIIAMTLPDNKT